MGEKQILAVGKIHPAQGSFDHRLKDINWIEGDRVCFDLEPLPARTAQEGWGYLDGEVLE